jgi:hypothetical protein
MNSLRPRRAKWDSAVLMLVVFDLSAFAAAIWLTLCVPEALDSAANSANASAWCFSGPAPHGANAGRAGI